MPFFLLGNAGVGQFAFGEIGHPLVSAVPVGAFSRRNFLPPYSIRLLVSVALICSVKLTAAHAPPVSSSRACVQRPALRGVPAKHLLWLDVPLDAMSRHPLSLAPHPEAGEGQGQRALNGRSTARSYKSKEMQAVMDVQGSREGRCPHSGPSTHLVLPVVAFGTAGRAYALAVERTSFPHRKRPGCDSGTSVGAIETPCAEGPVAVVQRWLVLEKRSTVPSV